MALAPARQAGGGGARIADFWRISAVFDPICRGPLLIITANETRAFICGSWPAGARIVARCWRDLPAGSWPAGAWIAGRGARFTVHGSRPAGARGAVHRPVGLGKGARGAGRLH